MASKGLKLLEERLGVRFRDDGLLAMSLTHTSYVNEHPDDAPCSNERLEFLGDALLGFTVAARLYREHPQMSEGELTAARAALVRGDSFAAMAVELGLGAHLRLGMGEEGSGGRHRASNLAGAFEAVIGAVYLDRGFSVARGTVLRLFKERIAAISHSAVPQDPKSLLQETMQGRGEGTPTYRVIQVEGPEHARRFTVQVTVGDRVLGHGSGSRKLAAERQAAQAALDGLPRGQGDGSDRHG